MTHRVDQLLIRSSNSDINIRKQEEGALQRLITEQLQHSAPDSIEFTNAYATAELICETTGLIEQDSLRLLQYQIMLVSPHDQENSFIYWLKFFFNKYGDKYFALEECTLSNEVKKSLGHELLTKSLEYLPFQDRGRLHTEVISHELKIIAYIIINRLETLWLTDAEQKAIELSLNYFRDMHFYQELRSAALLRETDPAKRQCLYDEICKNYPKYREASFARRYKMWENLIEVEKLETIIDNNQEDSKQLWSKVRHVFFDYDRRNKLVEAKHMDIEFLHEAFNNVIGNEGCRESGSPYFLKIWKQSKHSISYINWYNMIKINENLPATRYFSNEQLEQKHRLLIRNGKFYDTDGKLFDSSGAREDKLIDFVWRTNYKIFYYADNQIPDNTYWHHSSLAAGRPVLLAGELEIINGELNLISISSGHYKHDFKAVFPFLHFLRWHDVDLSDVIVMDWNDSGSSAQRLFEATLPKNRKRSRSLFE